MELINKTPEEVKFVTEIDVSLANAIRRSVGEISVLAVVEADIYKNECALYDEVIAHRLGLIPLKNQKLKKDQSVEMKLKVKGKGENTEVLAGDMNGEVAYPEMLIAILAEGQEIELVARAKTGTGNEHSKFMPGLAFYKHLPKIKLTGEGEKQTELAEIYPKAFEMFGEKIKVKDATEFDLDQEDLGEYPGVSVEFDDKLVFTIESWGQMKAEEIFVESCKSLKDGLAEVSKAIK